MLALVTVQAIAVHWWEGLPHPYEGAFVADDFAQHLLERLGLNLVAVYGDDASEDLFASMVGWKVEP